MSTASLRDWLWMLRSGQQIHVCHGTKGGRVRFVTPADREKAVAAVHNALQVMKFQEGRLIDKPDLKSALRRYSWICTSIGMVGEKASHSLRYAFAQQHLNQLKEIGVRQREARAIVSQLLGHGDGRGRWVASVYSR